MLKFFDKNKEEAVQSCVSWMKRVTFRGCERRRPITRRCSPIGPVHNDHILSQSTCVITKNSSLNLKMNFLRIKVCCNWTDLLLTKALSHLQALEKSAVYLLQLSAYLSSIVLSLTSCLYSIKVLCHRLAMQTVKPVYELTNKIKVYCDSVHSTTCRVSTVSQYNTVSFINALRWCVFLLHGELCLKYYILFI